MGRKAETPQTSEQLTDGTQTVADDNQVTEVSGQLAQLTNIPDSIRGLIADNARSLGSASTGQLMAAITSHFASELDEEKRKNERLEAQIESMREELTSLKVEKSVLQEKLNSSKSNRRLKNLIITMGSALFAYSTSLLTSEETQVVGIVTIIVAAVLIVAGWLSHEKKGDE